MQENCNASIHIHIHIPVIVIIVDADISANFQRGKRCEFRPHFLPPLSHFPYPAHATQGTLVFPSGEERKTFETVAVCTQCQTICSRSGRRFETRNRYNSWPPPTAHFSSTPQPPIHSPFQCGFRVPICVYVCVSAAAACQ